jgi:hypothetical protein
MSAGVSGLIDSLMHFRVPNSARQVTEQIVRRGQAATRRASGGLYGSAAALRRRVLARGVSLDSYKLYGNGRGRIDVLA